jgi:hypothetical protein
MKRSTISSVLILLFILVSLAACSSGGGSTNPPPPTKAVITLSMTGTLPAGMLIYGTQATVNLPPGVTAKASPSSANPQALVTDLGVVSASGQAAGAEIASGAYLASSTTPTTYKVDLSVSKSSGFSAGEFAVVNCDIAAGYFPAVTAFTVTDFKAVDQNGATLTGLTVGHTVAIQ